MKKTLSILVFSLLIFSCNKSSEEKNAERIVAADSVVAIDTIKEMVGDDVDAHGCKPSAGYTWSKLKQECVQLFEIGTRLNPYANPVKDESSAFVIFDGDQAELFLPFSSPMILKRPSEGMPFVSGDYQLIPWKGYVLKKSGTIIFIGQ